MTIKKLLTVSIIAMLLSGCFAVTAFASEKNGLESIKEGKQYVESYQVPVEGDVGTTENTNTYPEKTATMKSVTRKINGKKYRFSIKKHVEGYESKQTITSEYDEGSNTTNTTINYNDFREASAYCVMPTIKKYKITSVQNKEKVYKSTSVKTEGYTSTLNYRLNKDSTNFTKPSIKIYKSKNKITVHYTIKIKETNIKRFTISGVGMKKHENSTTRKITKIVTYKKK